jgi:DNA-binding transcriptional regulator YhcF (GntR family)
MSTLNEIRQAAEAYSDAVREVRVIQEAIEDEQRKIAKAFGDKLIAASKAAGEAKQMVLTVLEGAEGLFIKPRTVVIGNVTVGFRKQKGCIEVPSEEYTVAKIRESLPDKAGMLLNVRVNIIKKALDTLTAEELKRIGVTVTADTDAPVVDATDKELQKLIDKTISVQMAEAV